jgi:hypothetical protein
MSKSSLLSFLSMNPFSSGGWTFGMVCCRRRWATAL